MKKQVSNDRSVCLSNLGFLDRFSKITEILDFIIMHPFGAELFDEKGRTIGHTEMTKLIVPFSGVRKIKKSDY